MAKEDQPEDQRQLRLPDNGLDDKPAIPRHGRFFFGTSSWSEPSWKGVFYPRGLRPGDWLTHYAGRYRTVEADVTYYRIPSPEMVLAWERKTPDDFVLSAKFPRSIVHAGEGARPDPSRLLIRDQVGDDVEEFLSAMRLLGPKCGPLVLQFPYFNKSVFPGPEPFLERLDAFLATLPDDLRYGVEVRNKWWVAPPLLDLLRRHRCALVLVELAYMPHPASLDRRLDAITTDFGYVRLIGDRKAVEERTETFDRIVVDQGASLQRWAGLLSSMGGRLDTIFVYANNHYAGHAPATIEDLAGRVGFD